MENYKGVTKRFMERYGEIVGDKEAFLASILSRLPKSFRINTIKAEAKEVIKRFEEYGIVIKKVKWYKDAFVSESPETGKTLEHFLGWIYMQDLASMIPPLAAKKEVEKAEFVLDACAAPGSKTTQIAAIMKNRGLLVANDVDYKRIRALKFNIEKAGALNVAITNMDLRRFTYTGFDVVFLDVTCSAEGTCRRNPEVLSHWSEKEVIKFSNLQKQLILKAFELVSSKGVLIYSTCAFAPEENEEVIDYLLRKTDGIVERIRIKGLKTGKGIEEWGRKKYSREVKKTVRIWPHLNDTEGFFVARIRKP